MRHQEIRKEETKGKSLLLKKEEQQRRLLIPGREAGGAGGAAAMTTTTGTTTSHEWDFGVSSLSMTDLPTAPQDLNSLTSKDDVDGRPFLLMLWWQLLRVVVGIMKI